MSTVWTCGKCKSNFQGDDCPYCEVQRLREALEVAQIHLMNNKPHFALMDIEDALSTQSEMVIE